MSGRNIGQVSFNSGVYENDLWEYATQKEHGTFSQYVKRLIERDRESKKATHCVLPQDTNIHYIEEDAHAAGGFL